MKPAKLPATEPTIRFSAGLVRPEKTASWTVLTLPKGAGAKFPARGLVMIEATINSFPLLLCFLVGVMAYFAGCAKPADLPDLTVSAPSPAGFTRFRADLGARFPAERLKEFDTAVSELRLDAMYRDVATAEAREADMLRVTNGKTVHAVVLLGWQARKARFLREIAELDRMLRHDLGQQQRTAAGTPASILDRIDSEKELLARLHGSLAETERRLAELGRPGP